MKYRYLQIFCVVACLAILGLGWVSPNYLWWLFPLLAFYLGIISWGASNIRSGLFLNAISSSPKSNQLVLTFDDGPHPNTPAVLEVLKKYKAPATFFCIGKNVEAHPEIVEQILEEGHAVGNHTYSHPVRWGWLSTRRVKEEIEKGDAALEKITGKKNRLFRPPFGVTNPRIAKALSAMPLQVIGWDLRSLDTAIHDKQRLYKRVIHKIDNSSVVLFHDSQPHTPEVLERVLTYCAEAGIKIVPLDDLLKTA